MEPLTPLDVKKFNACFDLNSDFDFALYVESRGKYKALIAAGYGEPPSRLSDVQEVVEIPRSQLEALRV